MIATLAGSAAAQSARAPINTLNDLEATLLDCWVPPPIEQSRPGMQITVLLSFKRNGEMFGQPKIIFQSRDASDAERASYHTALAETLKRCASLPFTEAFGNGVAGEPFTMLETLSGRGVPLGKLRSDDALLENSSCRHSRACWASRRLIGTLV